MMNRRLLWHEKWNTIAGVPFPLRTTRIFTAYSILGEVLIFIFAIAIAVSAFTTQVLNEFTFWFVGASYLFTAVARCFYLRVFSSEILKCYTDLVRVLDNNTNFKDVGVDFDHVHAGNSRLVRTIGAMDIIINFSCVILFSGSSLLSFYITGHKDRLIAPKFVSLTDDFSFGFAATFQVISLLLASLKTGAMFNFSIAVINIQINNFKFLKEVLDEITQVSDSKTLEKRRKVLKKWTAQHQDSLRVTGQLSRLWGGLISADYVYTVSGLLLSSFAITTTHEERGFMQNLAFILGVFTVLVKVYVFSFLSDKLRTETERVTSGMYNTHLLELPKQDINSWNFLFFQAKTPVVLKSFKIVHVNMSTFSSLLRTTFSYYVTLLQLTYRYSK